MTPCLRPDELLDVVDGVAARDAVAHVDSCPHCQALVAEARAALAEAAQVDVPEPSPLFWPQVNARVRAAIADEAQAPVGWRAWLRLDVLVPLAGLATLVVALTSAIGRVPNAADAPAADVALFTDAPVATVDAAGAGDGALELVLDLVASLPESDWDTLGLTAVPDLGVAAQSLTPDEQQALSAILQAAVERPQS